MGGAALPCRCHSLCGGSAGGSASFSSPRSEALELAKERKSNETMKPLKPINFVTSEDVRNRTPASHWKRKMFGIFKYIYTIIGVKKAKEANYLG